MLVRKQKSKKTTLQTFRDIRAKKTEIQYEYLVEKHVIRANDSRYLILDKYAHLANNIYNQALYRFRQSLFKGKWLSYGALDKSFKQVIPTKRLYALSFYEKRTFSSTNFKASHSKYDFLEKSC